MNIESKRIAFACFLGSFIGALLALHFGFLWPFGVAIGGAVGYVSYAFRDVVVAFRNACRAVRGYEILKELALGMCAFVCLVLQFLGLLIGLAFLYAALIGSLFGSAVWIALIFGSGFEFNPVESGFWYAGNFANLLVAGFLSWKKPERNMMMPVIFVALTPVFQPVTALAITLFGLYLIGRAVVWLTMLCEIAFALVHSEIRLLCMTDAALGALLGYYFGNPFIGGLVGAALGVLNYEIISVRIYKFAPSKIFK